jgi:hypothetical protein
LLRRYHITPYSLYGAVSVGLKTDMILTDLARLCKTELPERVVETIRQCTQSYGKAKLVLHQNRYFIECADDDVLQTLLRDPKIGASRVTSSFRLPALEKSAPVLNASAAAVAANPTVRRKNFSSNHCSLVFFRRQPNLCLLLLMPIWSSPSQFWRVRAEWRLEKTKMICLDLPTLEEEE